MLRFTFVLALRPRHKMFGSPYARCNRLTQAPQRRIPKGRIRIDSQPYVYFVSNDMQEMAAQAFLFELYRAEGISYNLVHCRVHVTVSRLVVCVCVVVCLFIE